MTDHAPPLPDVARAELHQLRREVARLAEENALLHAQLDEAGLKPAVAGAPRVSRTRRRVGRLLGAAFLAAGFGMGILYARYVGTEFMEGFRDGYDAGSGASIEAPPLPPPPIPEIPAPPEPPAPPPPP